MCADNFNNRKMFERRNVRHDNKYQGAPTKCRLSHIRNIKFTQLSSLLLARVEALRNFEMRLCQNQNVPFVLELTIGCQYRVLSVPWSILVINAVWCYPHIIADKSHLTSQFWGKTKPKIDNRRLKNCQVNL